MVSITSMQILHYGNAKFAICTRTAFIEDLIKKVLIYSNFIHKYNDYGMQILQYAISKGYRDFY